MVDGRAIRSSAKAMLGSPGTPTLEHHWNGRRAVWPSNPCFATHHDAETTVTITLRAFGEEYTLERYCTIQVDIYTMRLESKAAQSPDGGESEGHR